MNPTINNISCRRRHIHRNDCAANHHVWGEWEVPVLASKHPHTICKSKSEADDDDDEKCSVPESRMSSCRCTICNNKPYHNDADDDDNEDNDRNEEQLNT